MRRESCDVCLLRGLKEFDDVVFPCLPLVRHRVFNVRIVACPPPSKTENLVQTNIVQVQLKPR